MNVLIAKLGATGDVVRTTPLIGRLPGRITWVTAEKNKELLQGLNAVVRCFSWSERDQAFDRNYDLIINLEDTAEVASFVQAVPAAKVCGAYLDRADCVRYTDSFREWFDLSIISVHGRVKADELKLRNRRTYQELVFQGLGLNFAGESYLLPKPIEASLAGDVAIAADSGAVWPMKRWEYYPELKRRLEAEGIMVNVLPKRSSLLEHLSDVKNHRCLVGGDSLPMHFALGTETPCVTLFNCTSPWEIYDYGVQTKIVSPLLEEFFYKRGYDQRATTAISVDQVFDAVIAKLEARPSQSSESLVLK